MSDCAAVCCRRPAVKDDIDGLINQSYHHLQAATAADQQDVMTSSEPVYELAVSTSPVSLTASEYSVTSPLYTNVISEHPHQHHHQQQQQSDMQHVYGEAAPCDEAAYQAVRPAPATAADTPEDEYMNVSASRV